MQLSSDERSHRVSLALASLAQFAVLLVVYSVGASPWVTSRSAL